MTLSPPQAYVPGQPYYLYLDFYDESSGVLTDPSTVQLDITYGSAVGLVPDFAGPYFYTGGSSAVAGTIWRLAAGQYAFWFDPGTLDLVEGVYVANWTCTYSGDEFLVPENFPITGGFVEPVPSGDVGFWEGSLSYQPSWATSPFMINFGATDDNGITWLWESIDGWDSPPAVGQVIQRAADHGGWAAPQYFGPRIITLTVMASAPTQALRDLARAQLQQCVPVGDLAVLVYNEPVPKLASVRRNASAPVTESCPTLVDVRFVIPLVAPDPRKYATTPQTAGLLVPPPIINPLSLPLAAPLGFPGYIPPSSTVVTALNAGTFESRPSITVAGPITSPAVTNAVTGQVVSFTGLTLASTDQLTLDMDNRQASLNGNFYPADVSSAWWVLEPGATQVYLGGTTTGGATLSMTYSSAWI